MELRLWKGKDQQFYITYIIPYIDIYIGYKLQLVIKPSISNNGGICFQLGLKGVLLAVCELGPWRRFGTGKALGVRTEGAQRTVCGRI